MLHYYHFYLYDPFLQTCRWRELFEELDTDRSGTVAFPELCEFLKSAGGGDLIPTLEDWMEDFDVNKDGQLNYREFLGFVSTLEN